MIYVQNTLTTAEQICEILTLNFLKIFNGTDLRNFDFKFFENF